jgi:FkbM family methyltransferase
MLVIYPFSVVDEQLALKNAQWIAELGEYKSHDVFILSDRRCNQQIMEDVVKTLGKVFRLAKHRLTSSDVDGWPEGANQMFSLAATLIQHTREWPCFFWLEPDAIPISPGWLDALEAEYKRGGKPFMGERVDLGAKRPDVPIHMSGVGIYQNPIYLLAGECYRAHEVAWDIAAKDQIIPNAHWTKLIQHYWKHGTFTHLNEIREETVVFHSSKDGSLIDVLRKNLSGSSNTESGASSLDASPRPQEIFALQEQLHPVSGSGDPPAQIHKVRDGTWVLENDAISGRVMEAGRLDFDPLIPYVLKHIRPGDTVVDVGAFIGDHTVAYSHAVGKAGKVFAYEPNPDAFKCLVHNTNGMSNVFGFCHALGAHDGVAGLIGDNPDNFASHFVDHSNRNGGPIIQVQRMDTQMCLFGQLDLIKMDVEGYELNALKGMEQLIEKFHPKMVIEINEIALKRQNATPEDVISWVVRHGYEVSILHRHGENVPFYDILALPAAKPPETISSAPAHVTESECVATPVAAPVAPRNVSVPDAVQLLVNELQEIAEVSPGNKAIVTSRLVYAGLRPVAPKKPKIIYATDPFAPEAKGSKRVRKRKPPTVEHPA